MCRVNDTLNNGSVLRLPRLAAAILVEGKGGRWWAKNGSLLAQIGPLLSIPSRWWIVPVPVVTQDQDVVVPGSTACELWSENPLANEIFRSERDSCH